MKYIDIPDTEEIEKWICDRISSKASRLSSPRPNLLVYVDVWIFDRLDLKKLRESCFPLRAEFPSIWLLRDGLIAKLYSDNEFDEVSEEWMEIPKRIEDWLKE